MKSFRLLLTWTTPSHDLKALDAMNNSGLSMIWKTSGCELKDLNSMIRVVDDMNDSRLWALSPRCSEKL